MLALVVQLISFKTRRILAMLETDGTADASVVLDASPEATREIVLKPSGDPEYNPCFG